MTENIDAAEVKESANADWVCRHCNHTNSGEAEHCANCAFHRDYDPEATPVLDFTVVQEELQRNTAHRREQWTFYFQAGTAVCSALVLVLFLVMSAFLLRNWPFHQAYIDDANQVADAILAVQARVQLGVSLAEYEDLLVPLMIENTKFKAVYSERTERQHQSYQKLVQAAEYYELAHDAWEQSLARNDPAHRANKNAVSTDASDEVTKLWNTAASNLMLALEDLR